MNAANYGVVDVTFGIGDPAWVYGGYTIGKFVVRIRCHLYEFQVLTPILTLITQLPENIMNGTVRAKTIAIHHETNCVRHDTGSVSGLYPKDVFPKSAYMTSPKL